MDVELVRLGEEICHEACEGLLWISSLSRLVRLQAGSLQSSNSRRYMPQTDKAFRCLPSSTSSLFDAAHYCLELRLINSATLISRSSILFNFSLDYLNLLLYRNSTFSGCRHSHHLGSSLEVLSGFSQSCIAHQVLTILELTALLEEAFSVRLSCSHGVGVGVLVDSAAHLW